MDVSISISSPPLDLLTRRKFAAQLLQPGLRKLPPHRIEWNSVFGYGLHRFPRPFSLLFYSTPSDPLPGGKLSCLSPFEQQTLLIHRQTNKFGTRRLQKLRGHRSAPVDFDCEVFEQPENLVGAGGEKTNRMARKCFYFDWRGKTDRFCSFTERDRERNIPENKQFSPSNSNLGLKG